jgi:signal transduction histidine kinase
MNVPDMFAQKYPDRSRSRLWTGRLWILSAALGVATLVSTATIIHDTGRQRAAAALVAKSTAGQIVSTAGGRLEILALETFAPVTPWDTRSSAIRGAELSALVRAQHNAEQCGCRDTLPADAFFRFDAVTGKLELMSVVSAPSSAPPSSAIEAAARAEAGRTRTFGHSQIHFVAAGPLSQSGSVMIVQRDERGAPIAVYGLVATANSIARTVFANITAHVIVGNFFKPDTLALYVTVDETTPILGTLRDDHPFRATAIPLGGPLEGLRVTAALTPDQAGRSLHISRQEVWHLGVLTLATILVIGFAVGSSRRDLMLARARSDFIAGVSHDLRMPLAQILIASETLTLRRERDERERLTLSSSIVRETRRLIGIVDNVLLFSRSGAVALKPTLMPLAVDALFDDVVDAVRLAVEDAGQTIEIPESTSLAIVGDRQLTRQALVNLVDNALKYGAPGQRIRLGAERSSETSVRLYVEDEGPGVPVTERARIFEPYERLSRDQISERTGTGLGLAVVRHIAEVCGGRVWLDESSGGGTRAVLELPSAELPLPFVQERELV